LPADVQTLFTRRRHPARVHCDSMVMDAPNDASNPMSNRDPQNMSLDPTCMEAVAGVFYEGGSSRHHRWVAKCSVHGRVMSKSFSVKRHGSDTAKAMAIQARRDMLRLRSVSATPAGVSTALQSSMEMAHG
jgi:hypothetical protein